MRITPVKPSSLSLRYFVSPVAAGFPSPADDYIERHLSLDELLIKHPSATYLVRAEGDSMIGSGIFNQDILLVDRSLTPRHGDIVVAAIGGELTCKYLNLKTRQLVSANAKYPPIPIPEDMECLIEGVVTSSLRLHRTVS